MAFQKSHSSARMDISTEAIVWHVFTTVATMVVEVYSIALEYSQVFRFHRV